MFQNPSDLKNLRETLSDHMELAEYFLGIHAFFDGEVIFARDVVQVNFDLPRFPVDFSSVWDWFRENLRGPAGQETFVYRLKFGVDDEQDLTMERLLEFTRDSPITIWMIDLAHQDTPTDGRRFVVVTVADKKQAKEFRENLHGRVILVAD